MGSIVAALVAFFASDIVSGLFTRLAIFAGIASLSIAFTSSMVSYAQSLIQPSMSPEFMAGLSILPSSTSTYLTLIISATMAKWLFISAVKAIYSLK